MLSNTVYFIWLFRTHWMTLPLTSRRLLLEVEEEHQKKTTIFLRCGEHLEGWSYSARPCRVGSSFKRAPGKQGENKGKIAPADPQYRKKVRDYAKVRALRTKRSNWRRNHCEKKLGTWSTRRAVEKFDVLTVKNFVIGEVVRSTTALIIVNKFCEYK